MVIFGCGDGYVTSAAFHLAVVIYLFHLWHHNFHFVADMLEKCWDPLSSTQSHKIKDLIFYLIENFPSISLSCHSYQKMSKVMIKRLNETLKNDVFVPMFPQE